MSSGGDIGVPPEPTGEQCNRHAALGGGWFALWYPQMGGYVGKAAAYINPANPDDCVDVYVWHDGEFPFTADSADDTRPPYLLHHCETDQFRQFADVIDALREGTGK